jgi:hypothetical protein
MAVLEELEHVPRGERGSPQNELRLVFTILRQSAELRGKSPLDVLGRAVGMSGRLTRAVT